MSRDQIYELAKQAGAKFPELVVAQYVIESGDGKYLSGRNNFFGIKGKGTVKQTQEYINGKRVTIRDEFKDFSSPAEAVQYLVDKWYKDWNGHKGVNNAATANEAASMLVSEGYATDPKYSAKLVRVMAETKKQLNYADLVDAARHFSNQPQQVKALQELQVTLTAEQREQFTSTWRSAPVKPAASKPKFPMDVPYHWQRDSKTGHGERMCQSSAISMRIEQIDPNIIKDDDDYLKIVHRYGDTTAQSAHQKALDHLNLKHRFRQDGTEKLLCELLDQGMAVPIGILHKGPVSRPSGGGHWVTLIGYDTTHFFVHDPFGELDLVNGGYPKTGPTDGKCVRYSRKNLMKRWLIASQSDGWLWEIWR